MLAPNVAEQLAQLRIEITTAATVTPGPRHQRFEPALLEGVQPALQRCDRIAACRVAAGRTHPLLAQSA